MASCGLTVRSGLSLIEMAQSSLRLLHHALALLLLGCRTSACTSACRAALVTSVVRSCRCAGATRRAAERLLAGGPRWQLPLAGAEAAGSLPQGACSFAAAVSSAYSFLNGAFSNAF